MSKTMLKINGDDINFGFSITKIDKAKRTVTGVATANNVDSDNDLMDINGSYDAFSKWRGNIREMHAPKAVGKSVSASPVKVVDDNGTEYDGIEVTAYISKGAEDTWQKCLDGTLAGFSIGGRILEKVKEFNKELGKTYTRVTKYVLGELSLVDNPANQLAMLTIVKSVNGVVELTDIVAENHTVFYCSEDGVAKLDDNICSKCESEMVEIGYVEATEEFTADTINKMIQTTLEKSEDSKMLHNNNIYGTVGNMELTEEETSLFKRLMKFLAGSNDEVKGSAIDDSKQNREEGIVEEVAKSAVEEVAAEASAEVAEAKIEVEASLLKSIQDSLEDIKKDIGRTVAGSGNNVERIGAVTGTNVLGESPNDQSGARPDTFNPGIIDLTNKVEVFAKTLGEAINKVEGSMTDLAARIEKLESSGAVKKSAVNDDDNEKEVVTKSAKVEDDGWGNAFVPASVIADLGYSD